MNDAVDGAARAAADTTADKLRADRLWYKDAIIYQTHVKAYGDSNGDGIGDFRGLTERLDYIQQLGVTAVWLLPFYPSPQRDDGYDISEYRQVHPDYGTMADCRRFIREAHRRNLKVITELIINHTSDQHPWFQAARRAPKGSAKRDYYVWSDDDTRYSDSRIIFTDTETSNWAWDPVAKQYYWHRFFSHQPDLNFDNPRVLRAVLKIMYFWLDLGVDGLRLDAIPYLIEREGTSCENLPETHGVLKQIRAALDARYPDRMLLAEANQWPEDVREYFADGDECHMAYHFPVMPRMYMAVAQEDRFPIIDIMSQTPEIPDNCQWAIFLRNHDELTLEMVTDRERDYMYRTYAHDPRMRINVGIRRRLAPLLDNDIGKIKLMHSLLFSLLGTPVLYYGDEIGMGDNIYLGDRNGVRTPMQWSPDRNAGFSRADPQRLYLPPIMDPSYGYESVNVEAQQRSPASLLNWMRRMIAVRRQHPAFGRGALRFLGPDNRRVLAYVRTHERENGALDTILCLANLSRSPQPVELNLGEFEGKTPVELTGRTVFPRIGSLPYFITLQGHGFYWFELIDGANEPDWLAERGMSSELPVLVMSSGLASLVGSAQGRGGDAGLRRRLVELLPGFLLAQRWFAAKAEPMTEIEIDRLRSWEYRGGRWLLAWIHVRFEQMEPQRYFLPLGIAWDDTADDLVNHQRASVLARVRQHARVGVLIDAFIDPDFCRAFAVAIAREERVAIDDGGLDFTATSSLLPLLGLDPSVDAATRDEALASVDVEIPRAQGSNTAIVLRRRGEEQGEVDEAALLSDEIDGSGTSHRVFLKAYRQVQRGVNPELEIGRFLSAAPGFDNSAALGGSIEHVDADGVPSAIAIVQGHVANQGDAWEYTLGYLERFFEEHLSSTAQQESTAETPEPEPDPHDGFADLIKTLGQRTAELHLAFLAADPEDAAFSAEVVEPADIERWSAVTREAIDTTLDRLAASRERLPDAAQADIERLLEQRDALVKRADIGHVDTDSLVRIRQHGDYHLGQVLVDRNDFIIIDFEGEPNRSLDERREKHSPLRDVAGMLRSFDYAAASALQRAAELWPQEAVSFAPKLESWRERSMAAFTSGYRATAGEAPLWPTGSGDELLSLLVLDKALYELRYELAQRPAWIHVPVGGLLRLA